MDGRGHTSKLLEPHLGDQGNDLKAAQVRGKAPGKQKRRSPEGDSNVVG